MAYSQLVLKKRHSASKSCCIILSRALIVFQKPKGASHRLLNGFPGFERMANKLAKPIRLQAEADCAELSKRSVA
jgi:hypothetical protein